MLTVKSIVNTILESKTYILEVDRLDFLGLWTLEMLKKLWRLWIKTGAEKDFTDTYSLRSYLWIACFSTDISQCNNLY